MNAKKLTLWISIILLLALTLPGCSGKSFTAVTVGGETACALTSTGEVLCWGTTYLVEGGVEANPKSRILVPVSGLSAVTAIAAGDMFTCALTGSTGVKCWSAGNEKTPVEISGLSGGITAITAGKEHTCVLTASGGVKCWGANHEGQLGDGTTTDSNTPVDVTGLPGDVTAITAAGDFTCASTSSGGILCWGLFPFPPGNITGPASYATKPVAVSGLSGVKAIDGGLLFACLLTGGNGVQCWGANRWGQLGIGTITDSDKPVEVNGLTDGVVKIAAGGSTVCALTSAGGVKCWGINNQAELGIGKTSESSTIPVDVSGLTSGVTEIAVGDSGACALTRSGGIKCWGSIGRWYSATPQDVQ